MSKKCIKHHQPGHFLAAKKNARDTQKNNCENSNLLTQLFSAAGRTLQYSRYQRTAWRYPPDQIGKVRYRTGS